MTDWEIAEVRRRNGPPGGTPMSPSSPTPVPATTARPTVADALTYFRRNPESLDDIEYGGSDAVQRMYAATLVRAALAVDPSPLDVIKARVAATIHMGLGDATPNEGFDPGPDMAWRARLDEWVDWIHEQYRSALASSPPAGDTTTETRTEYRITSRTPNGLGRRLSCGSSLDKARERAAVLRAEGSTEVTVESRTVSTTRTESPWEEDQ